MNVIPFRNVSGETELSFLVLIQCYVTLNSLRATFDVGVGFAGQLVHIGGLALLLLVKFKPLS